MKKHKSINEWWNNLLKENRRYWGAGYDLIDNLNKSIEQFEEIEKTETINFLTKKAIQKDKDFAIALCVLENHCSPSNLELIFNKAKTFDLLDRDIIYYLRVLGKHGNERHKELLENFLLSKNLNPNHSSVIWATYPNFPDLFAKAYTKYLTETNISEWAGSLIVSAFMEEPGALRLLLNNLKKENLFVFESFKTNLKKEFLKNCWDKSSKEKVRKLIYERKH
ncbi:MAG: hypothetical protein JJ966_13670 [Balneolaceae bacterium]|nr:hypothetical protein [Balneolaceae bacterium]